MPKIKHFMWKALAGALAVLEGLRSRGMATSRLCYACDLEPETICHALFFCLVAAYTWALSKLPTPPLGFSKNSVLLNFHHLLACMRNISLEKELRSSIPWILWEIWKGRNLFVFERKRTDTTLILSKAQADAGSWLEANQDSLQVHQTRLRLENTQVGWVKPSEEVVKCNVASSWINGRSNCGVSWIVRDHQSRALAHSRRSYSGIDS